MRTLLLLGAAAGLALAVGAPAEAKPQQEKESAALKRAIKNQKKLKSYKSDASVVGGITRGENPKSFSRSLANSKFMGELFGGVEKINRPEKAYRPRRASLTKPTGVVKKGRIWKGIMGCEEGRLVNRLYLPPEAVLDTIYKNKKYAKWLPPGESKYGNDEPAPAGQDESIDWGEMGLEDEEPEKPAKKTRQRSKKKKKKTKSVVEDGPISHSMILKAPLKTAVETFNYYMDSGCGGSQAG